jgi:septal ring factor EnvC (AmiA/AmiB activator)
MSIEMSHLVTIISCIVAVVALFRKYKNDNKTDVGEITTVIVKVEDIREDTKDIKKEMKEVKTEVNSMKEKIALTEASVKSAHKRIDYLSTLISPQTPEKE